VSDVERASLAELLCALSFASDVGMGQPMEHGLKTGYLGLQIADVLGLPLADRQAIFYGSLIKDAGCTACAAFFAAFFAGDDITPRSDCLLMKTESVRDAVAWFWRYAPEGALPWRMARFFSFMTSCRSAMRENITAHCEVGEMFARRLGLPEGVQRAVRYSWERWDGGGLAYGLAGENVPIAARTIHVAQVAQVAHYVGGPAAATEVARERRGKDFDPALVDALLRLAQQPVVWEMLDQDAAQEIILEARPPADFDSLAESQVDTICEVLADFADVKTRLTWNHSPDVAEAAVGIGRRLGLDASAAKDLRRAALVHDLGKAAVPLAILDKGDRLTAGEWERFRLHPYYTERVLARVAPLRGLAGTAASHHEWLNGQGYHRRVAGVQIPRGGRILATADTYVALLRQAGEPAKPERVLGGMRPLVGIQLDGACYEALQAFLSGAAPRPSAATRPYPANLSEREVEVLRLLVEGLGNRELARKLVLSEKTVEHHLDHIYSKLGVSCRTAAAVFAVQRGLVS